MVGDRLRWPRILLAQSNIVVKRFFWSACHVNRAGNAFRLLSSIAWLPSLLKRVGDVVVVGPVAARHEEPQLVLQDRPAGAVVDVVVAIQLVRCGNPSRPQLIVEVHALRAAVGEVDDAFAQELVAAGARNPVHEHARQLVLGRPAGDLHGHFLRLRLVVVHAGALAVAEHRVDHHAVDERARIVAERAVHEQAAADPHRARPADVEPAGADRRHRVGHQHETAAGRNRLEQLLADHLAARAGLHVDDRALPGDRDVLGDRADAHLDVDRRGEVGFEQNPLAHDRVETRQREGDGVGARPQVDDPVLARLVGRGRFHLLDQRGAAGFDRHAGQHRAGRVLDDAGDRALRQGDGRNGQRSRSTMRTSLRNRLHISHDPPRNELTPIRFFRWARRIISQTCAAKPSPRRGFLSTDRRQIH